jgi:threonine/homoserine/homoserine lactone efflux protein
MIGYLLPAALGVTLSPIPIIAVVLVLGGPKARSSGPALASGWIVGLAAVSTLAAVVFDGAEVEGSTPSTAAYLTKVASGALFLYLASVSWKKRPRRGEDAVLPPWMTSVETVGAPKALFLGVGLSGLNPKNLVLALTAAASVAEAGLDVAQGATAVVAFVLLGSLTVIGPVAFHLVAPARAARPMVAIREFMTDNSAVISMAILLLLGGTLLGDGLSGLL